MVAVAGVGSRGGSPACFRLLDLQASFGETSRAAAQNTVITSREVGNGEQSG